jgi:hypothetical protein
VLRNKQKQAATHLHGDGRQCHHTTVLPHRGDEPVGRDLAGSATKIPQEFSARALQGGEAAIQAPRPGPTRSGGDAP